LQIVIVYNNGLLSLSNSLSNTEVTNDKIRLNKSAQPKLAILMPLTNLLAISTTRAFMTNKNNPSVRIVTGRVRRMISGFTKVFRIASTTANTIAVQKVSMCMPGNTCARPNDTAAITMMRIRNLINAGF